jgi:long-chain fatty acid transport protein
VHLSAFWEASPELALGLAFRSRSTLGLDGGADFERIPDAFAARAHDQLATGSLPLPDRLALGGRWRRGNLAVLADVALVFWDRYDALRIDFEDPFTPDVEQITDWRLAASIRAGAEWRMRESITLRGGAFLDPSPVPAETLAPSSPDSTRIGASLGGGLLLGGGFHLDAGYSLLFVLSRGSESQDALPARYSGVAHLISFGVRYAPNESAR